MSSLPKISIVTPSFNQGEFIEETINSVLDQGYKNLQYIIIDGGSTDNSVDIIKKYDKHLDFWISEKDEGQSDAINKGLKKANGELFNWLNSDDTLSVGALNKIGKAYLKDDNVHCIAGNIRVFGSEDWIYQDQIVQHNSQVLTMAKCKIKQPSTFYSMSAIRKMGDLNTDLHYIMDYEWFIRFLLTHSIDSIVEIDQVISNFRIHDGSKTGSDIEAFERDKEKFWDEIWAWLNGENHQVKIDKEMYSSDLVMSALNLIYYRRLVLAYKKEDRRYCKEIINKINAGLLDQSRLLSYQKMKQRVNWLPSILRKR